MTDQLTENRPVTKSPEESNGETIIEIKNLKKGFGKQVVLNDVSFDLHKGENLAVLGKSGTGKSVLIKCIVRLMIADDGEINVLGKNVRTISLKELNEVRKKVGFLFQGAALYDSMTVKQNLEFTLTRIHKKLPPKEVEEKIHEALENVGLADAWSKLPSQLSGGMRKRIGLARTIVADPQVILYDEPTTGLDPVTSGEISDLITEIQTKYQTSSIIITHDMSCVRKTANRVIMLRDGEVYVNSTPEELEQSQDKWIQSFFQ
jgi:phospholipid/cholesterol/gamma-HCH transport system ATP-binding protein